MTEEARAWTIWKWTLLVTDEQTVEMPKGAELLSVAEQVPTAGRALQLWALVDSDAETVERLIVIHGTGHPAEKSLHATQHIGTVITFGGSLVWHVFDGGESTGGRG